MFSRVISTHTPHAGRDAMVRTAATELADFYSHAPCGARHVLPLRHKRYMKFLLTRPMRGATWNTLVKMILGKISTHTPHAGRD